MGIRGHERNPVGESRIRLFEDEEKAVRAEKEKGHRVAMTVSMDVRGEQEEGTGDGQGTRARRRKENANRFFDPERPDVRNPESANRRKDNAKTNPMARRMNGERPVP